MESVNKQLCEELCSTIDNYVFIDESKFKLVRIIVSDFFRNTPDIYFEKPTTCKPCWRCHGTGTNESMS